MPPKNERASLKKIGEELSGYAALKAALESDLADDPQCLLDTLEGETELHEACLAVVEFIDEKEVMLEGIKTKLAEYADRKARVEHSIKTLRNVILMTMDRADLDTIKGALCTLSRGKVKPGLEIVDEALVPSEYFIPVAPKVDRKALLAALQEGAEVEGARLDNGGIKLGIRRK